MSLRHRLIRWLEGVFPSLATNGGGGGGAKPAPQDLRGWKADWGVGDLALCVDGDFPDTLNRCGVSGPAPLAGRIYRVTGLAEGPCFGGTALISALYLDGCNAKVGFRATCFRKIRPDVASEEVNAEVVARIKRAGKVPVAGAGDVRQQALAQPLPHAGGER